MVLSSISHRFRFVVPVNEPKTGSDKGKNQLQHLANPRNAEECSLNESGDFEQKKYGLRSDGASSI